MRPGFDLSTLILTVLAVALAVIAYLKDPGLPAMGVRNGVSFLLFIFPRLVPALIVAGLIQVLVPQEFVAYMTAWSLFGMQRIICWEAPIMGWHFVFVRGVSSLAFPVVAGLLVNVFYGD